VRVFQSTYKGRDGATRKTARWYIEIRIESRPRRVPGFTDRKATEALGRSIEALARCKAGGERPDAALARWIEGLPRKLRAVLARIGLLAGCRAAALEPLLSHLDGAADAAGTVVLVGFRQALAAKGATARHVDLVANRARRVIEGCGFVFWSDVSASKVMAYLDGLRADTLDEKGKVAKRGIGAQSFNFYLAAFKQFCRWMVKDGRASESPVAHLDGLNVRTDRRHDRRALTVDEVRRLLTATAAAPDGFGMTGPDRAMLYRVAVETGLRAAELASLTRASFILDGPRPTVTVLAAYSKHRRQDELPLRPDTAAALRAFLAGKLPTAPAFNVPTGHLAAMLRADLKAAGIDYRDDAGRVVDFHALRHTAGTLLAATGAHPKVAQSLMRHSDINLTMSRYSHVLIGQESEAVAALPDLSAPPAEAVRDTGTAGPEPAPARLALCLALSGRKQVAPVHSGTQNHRDMTEGENGEKPPEMAENGPFADAGGEAGIRTQDQGLSPDNGLANRRFRPLSHLSARFACMGILPDPHRLSSRRTFRGI